MLEHQHRTEHRKIKTNTRIINLQTKVQQLQDQQILALVEARAADLYIKNREQGLYDYATDLVDQKINPFVKEMQQFDIVTKKI